MKAPVFLLALLTLAVSLRSELLPIRTYTTADGLALDRVDSIVADSRGFLWFCTPEGLSRFDGDRFKSYGVSDGLPHPMVTALQETRSGKYFVGTAAGMCRFNVNGSGNRFSTYLPGKEWTSNFVEALFESRSGRLWCGTKGGLFTMDSDSHFHLQHLPISGRIDAGAIAEDKHGNLWIATNSGVFVSEANGGVQSFDHRSGLPGNWATTLLIDTRGEIWVGMRGGVAVLREGPSRGAWTIESVYTHKQGLIGEDVQEFVQASDGTIWIATQNGISRVVSNSNGSRAIQNLTRANGLVDREIISLAEDEAGNMWAGTEGAGVMKINRGGFTTFHEADGLRSDRIWSVFDDRAGTPIVITDSDRQPSRTLNIFDGHKFRVVAPKVFADQPGWGRQQILLQSRAGEWWAATRAGLCKYHALDAIQLDAKRPQVCFSKDEVFRIFEDSKGGIWASTQSQRGDRLMRWNPVQKTISYFAPDRDSGPNPELFGELVSAFAEDGQGNVWAGMWSGDVYRYDGRAFKRFGRREGIPAGSIYSLFVDHAGQLWIGSAHGGLGRIANPGAENIHVEVYDDARGLSSNQIQCIVQDDQGRIYAGTGKGVDRLDPPTGHIKHFSAADGLPHGAMTAAFRDQAGALWFGTTQGLSRLVPAKDRPRAGPPVLITDLRVAGVPYPISQLGESHLSGLELKPSNKQLQVEFVGLDYEPGESLRYSYKLEGADSNWSVPRAQHVVNYAALTDGTYRFLVKAVNSENVESPSPAEIEFTVLPPLWKRWWFESLAAAILVSTVLAAHRYRLAQTIRLERLRTAIATDLHDDIGAGLSQIAILTEVARLNGRQRQGRLEEPLERVASLARELVDSIGDIVWSIRAEPDGMDALIRRMRLFGLDVLTSRGILFEMRAPEDQMDVQLSLQSRRQLFLIYKECIHNAVRHSSCTEVTAELVIEERQAVLNVADNGIGIDTSDRKPQDRGGTGIPSMRSRAESLGGALQMRSTLGQGCTVAVKVPIQRSAFRKPTL